VSLVVRTNDYWLELQHSLRIKNAIILINFDHDEKALLDTMPTTLKCSVNGDLNIENPISSELSQLLRK